MTPDEAWEGIAYLVTMTTGWTNESADEYVVELLGLDDVPVFLTACREVARTWGEARRPPLVMITDAYYAELARHPTHKPAIDPVRVHCDGSGWVPGDLYGLVPCERCNPALARVWSEPILQAQYLDGRPLDDLVDNVEAKRGSYWLMGARPPRCGVHPEMPAELPAARAAARRGYESTCRTQGRAPDGSFFDRDLKDML